MLGKQIGTFRPDLKGPVNNYVECRAYRAVSKLCNVPYHVSGMIRYAFGKNDSICIVENDLEKSKTSGKEAR